MRGMVWISWTARPSKQVAAPVNKVVVRDAKLDAGVWAE